MNEFVILAGSAKMFPTLSGNLRNASVRAVSPISMLIWFRTQTLEQTHAIHVKQCYKALHTVSYVCILLKLEQTCAA